MKKTSVYLTEAELDRLRRASAQTGRTQSQILREAVATYTSEVLGRRRFVSAGAGKGKRAGRSSIADEDLTTLVRGLVKARADRDRS